MGKFSKILEKSGYSNSQTVLEKKTETSSLFQSSGRRAGAGEQDGKPESLLSSTGWDERLTKVVSFSSEISESFRILRSKILMPQDDKKVTRSIMVTSALPKEGKSFVSANLGIALAQGMDQHSLIVDCDLRLPSLAKLFGVPNVRGLSDYLQQGSELNTLIQRTPVDKMSVITSGVPPVNPAELLGSVKMHDLVGELTTRYPDRYVIFDTPPLQVASESIVLSQVVDGVVLVVRYGVSSKQLIERVINDIGKHKILGIIFNGHQTNFISSRLVNKNYNYYSNYYKE